MEVILSWFCQENAHLHAFLWHFRPIEEYPYRLLFFYIRDECDGRQKEENYLFFPASVTQVWRYILT